jgi:hypothetical protein
MFGPPDRIDDRDHRDSASVVMGSGRRLTMRPTSVARRESRAGEERSWPCSSGLFGRDTRKSPRSVFKGDNVRLDLAVYSSPPEPPGDGFRRNVGGFAKPRGVARLDLVPQWRSLTVCKRR